MSGEIPFFADVAGETGGADGDTGDTGGEPGGEPGGPGDTGGGDVVVVLVGGGVVGFEKVQFTLASI